MYVFKMDDDKTLIVTVQGHLYKGERNADDAVFLLPPSYQGETLEGNDVIVRCVLPDGGKYTRTLDLMTNDYKGYLKYVLPVTEVMTVNAGVIELWLTVYGDEKIILKTSTAIMQVRMNWDGNDAAFAGAAIDDLYLRLNELENEQADDLVFDEETQRLQLAAGTETIGEGVVLPELSAANYDKLQNKPVVNLSGTPVVVSSLVTGVYNIDGTWAMTLDDAERQTLKDDLFYVSNDETGCHLTWVTAGKLYTYYVPANGSATDIEENGVDSTDDVIYF